MAACAAGPWPAPTRAPGTGPVSVLPSSGQESSTGTDGVAPATMELIDTETRRIVEECYQQAVETMRGSRDRLAHTLLDRETLEEDEAYAAAGVSRDTAARAAAWLVTARTPPVRKNLLPNGRGFTSRAGADTSGPAARWRAQRPACSASGQQGAAGCHERGRERFEQLLERGLAVGLAGHEGAVDGGEREARELAGDRAARIVAERARDLGPQEIEGVLAYPADDSLYLSVSCGGGLGGEDDQQPEEVRVALERADRGRHHPGQVLRGAPGPPGQVGQVGEEAVGAAFHDGEQDAVLGAEVVVDGAHRDAGFLHHAGQRGGFEAVLGHDPLGGVQHQFAGFHAPAVGRYFCACHAFRIAQVLELTLQSHYCSVHSSSSERRRHAYHRRCRGRRSPGPDRGRRRRRPDQLDAAGPPGGGAPAGQRAPADL